MLVENWKHLWKSWSIQMAALGAILPSLLQILADNSTAIPWFDEGIKSGMRLTCLVLIPVLRALQQSSIPKP